MSIPAQMASFESEAALGWGVTLGNWSIVRDSGQAHAGMASMRATRLAGPPGASAFAVVELTSGFFAIDASFTSVSGWVRPDIHAASTDLGTEFVVSIYDGGFTLLDTWAVFTTNPANGAWSEIVASGTVAAGAVWATLLVGGQHGGIDFIEGDAFYFDDFAPAGTGRCPPHPAATARPTTLRVRAAT